MDSHDNEDGTEPVSQSRAGPGTVSDPVEDGFAAEVKNGNGEACGFLIEWRAKQGEWLYADDFESYSPLIP